MFPVLTKLVLQRFVYMLCYDFCANNFMHECLLLFHDHLSNYQKIYSLLLIMSIILVRMFVAMLKNIGSGWQLLLKIIC